MDDCLLFNAQGRPLGFDITQRNDTLLSAGRVADVVANARLVEANIAGLVSEDICSFRFLGMSGDGKSEIMASRLRATRWAATAGKGEEGRQTINSKHAPCLLPSQAYLKPVLYGKNTSYLVLNLDPETG